MGISGANFRPLSSQTHTRGQNSAPVVANTHQGAKIRGGSSRQGRPIFGAVSFGKVEYFSGAVPLSRGDPASHQPARQGNQAAKGPAKGPATVPGKPSGPWGRSPVVRATDLQPEGVVGRPRKWPKGGRTGPGRVRLAGSGRKTESQLKPGPSGRVSELKTALGQVF